jgi:hypothetical protein
VVQLEAVGKSRLGEGDPETFAQGLSEVDRKLVAIAAAGVASFLRMIATTSRMAQGDIVKGLVFHAIWTSNVRHITYSADNLKFGHVDDAVPDDMIRPVSVMSVAGGLRIPYETARRHAQTLVEEGRLVRMPRGMVIPRAEYNAHMRPEVICAEAPSFLLLFSDLKHAGFDFTPFHRRLQSTQAIADQVRDTPHFRALVRVGCEFFLRCLDGLADIHNNSLVSGVVYLGIWQGDVRMHGRHAGRIAAGQPTYRVGRRDPVTLRAVAETLDIPYETVRRHANVLRREHRIVRASMGETKGYYLAANELKHPDVMPGLKAMNRHVIRLISDLHRAGFDFSIY